MPKAKINGIDMYYEVHGQGFPLILMHAFAGTSQMWQPQVSSLSQKCKLIIFDARGHGQTESPRDPASYREENVVKDMYQLLHYLGIKKAVVGGLSLGGYIALSFCLAHPDMVAALVVVGAGPGFRNPERREEWNRRAEDISRSLLEQGTESLSGIDYVSRESTARHDPVGIVYMARGALAVRTPRVIEGLPQIKVPTLILVGSQDTDYLGATSYMKRVIANAELVEIADAGHTCNMDQPQVFNSAVIDFLDKVVSHA